MSLFGKIAKNIANEVKPTVSIDVDGPNITKPSIGFNIQAPVPKIDITAQGHGPSIGINAQSNFQPKGINVDISGQGYGSQGTYPPHGGFGPGGFGPQGNYPPQGGYGSQGAYPPQGPQGGYGPHGGYPPQGNYPPQGGYPPQQDSELINSLNETIKSYEAKLKVSETDYINLKQIRTVVFSDGDVKSKSEVKTHETNEYFFKNKKYTLPINKVNTQEVYYENYSYIITYLIALEFKTFGKLKGWFDTVKDISVYLKDINDKKALENVKKLIREINYQSIDIDGVFHETHAKKLTLR